jgi:hypothetical protein
LQNEPRILPPSVRSVEGFDPRPDVEAEELKTKLVAANVPLYAEANPLRLFRYARLKRTPLSTLTSSKLALFKTDH